MSDLERLNNHKCYTTFTPNIACLFLFWFSSQKEMFKNRWIYVKKRDVVLLLSDDHLRQEEKHDIVNGFKIGTLYTHTLVIMPMSLTSINLFILIVIFDRSLY